MNRTLNQFPRHPQEQNSELRPESVSSTNIVQSENNSDRHQPSLFSKPRPQPQISLSPELTGLSNPLI